MIKHHPCQLESKNLMAFNYSALNVYSAADSHLPERLSDENVKFSDTQKNGLLPFFHASARQGQ